jgi:hypothetical protein
VRSLAEPKKTKPNGKAEDEASTPTSDQRRARWCRSRRRVRLAVRAEPYEVRECGCSPRRDA